MDRTPRGCDDRADDPLPYVRGLYRLIPEGRLAAILSPTGRSSERRRLLPADAVVWLVVAMALFAADSIPKVWRRPSDRRRLLPGLEADGDRRHDTRPTRHRGERPHLRPADDRAGRRRLPTGPPAGPVRVGDTRRLRPGDQADLPRRGVHGRAAARSPRAGDLLIWDRGFFSYESIRSLVCRG